MEYFWRDSNICIYLAEVQPIQWECCLDGVLFMWELAHSFHNLFSMNWFKLSQWKVKWCLTSNKLYSTNNIRASSIVIEESQLMKIDSAWPLTFSWQALSWIINESGGGAIFDGKYTWYHSTPEYSAWRLAQYMLSYSVSHVITVRPSQHTI